jgi:hypothetical protein
MTKFRSRYNLVCHTIKKAFPIVLPHNNLRACSKETNLL